MDLDTQDMLYKKIVESVHDEEKIVTCASIVRELKVPISDAKALLKTFVSDPSNTKAKEFRVTYLLSGSLKDGKGLAICLVKEEELEQKKNLFDIISSETVFSIQKCKDIDFDIIASIDKISLEPTPEPFNGCVVSNNCIKRELKPKVLPPVKETTVKENGSYFQKVCSNGIQKADVKGKPGKPVGSITNFFSKSTLSKTNGSTKVEDGVKKPVKSEDINGSMSQDEVCDNDKTITNSEENSPDEKMDVENIPQPVLEKTKDQDNSKKRKKKNKNNAVPNKKRKRIQDICDSDSSDIFEEEKDEDIIEKSDEEPEPVTLRPTPIPKKKTRKAVDKTYRDEEGYMVTTTEYIYESASEDEAKEIIPCSEVKPPVLVEKKNSTDFGNDVKKNKNKNKSGKKAAPGKQTTLMNFFKKS